MAPSGSVQGGSWSDASAARPGSRFWIETLGCPKNQVDSDKLVGTLVADGLVPAIAQDVDNGDVLMLAWMNAESLRRTVDEGRMVYWSRSRQELWRKGDTSGDHQVLREAYYDCDADVLLFLVEQEGKGACHTGEYSCFFRRFGEGESTASPDH
jgi:phosphoribosyl-AMP cyclohydrolase